MSQRSSENDLHNLDHQDSSINLDEYCYFDLHQGKMTKNMSNNTKAADLKKIKITLFKELKHPSYELQRKI